ncbi:MAG: hypothetical protein HDR29_02320 [Lachnospiraceae bacterium]|nr:hypothetical protein [Lachnospiraceae bacterium]
MEKDMKIRRISCKDLIGCLFILASLIMLGNSIRLCFSSDIWYDELFTMGMVEHSYGELIAFTARDVHPPLYYCIGKFALDLCKLMFPLADSVIIIKMVSVMPYFLLIIYAVTFLRKRFGLFVSGVFLFCILAMPQMSAYTVEMRMYGWALFFVTAAFFHAYEIICSGGSDITRKYYVQNYVAILLYGLAAAYTQYFACVAVVMIYLCLLVWIVLCYGKSRYQKSHDGKSSYVKTRDKAGYKALKGWFGCVALSIIGYLPWLFVLISQITAIRDNYWILPLTWRSIGGCVKFLMKPAFQNEMVNVVMAVVLFGIYAGLIVAYGYSVWKRRAGDDVRSKADSENVDRIDFATFYYTMSGCLVLFGLVLFGFIASIIIRPIFVYRYMLPAVGCFWLCFAFCLDNLSGRVGNNYYNIRILCSCIIATFVLIVGARDYRAFMGEEEYRAVLMKGTAQAISDIDKNDIILYNFDQLQAVCGYYMDQENYLWNGEPEQLIVDMFGNKGSIQAVSGIKEWLDEGKTVWFFGSFNSREGIREEWEKDGISTDETGSYMLERYWFNIYKVHLDSKT